jgi:hypothetical protein
MPAGHERRCAAYLMGNHPSPSACIATTPASCSTRPAHQIHEDPDDRTRLSVDQPSTVFSSFGDPEIAKVGVKLDAKLADLFATLVADERRRNPDRGRPASASRRRRVEVGCERCPGRTAMPEA